MGVFQTKLFIEDKNKGVAINIKDIWLLLIYFISIKPSWGLFDMKSYPVEPELIFNLK